MLEIVVGVIVFLALLYLFLRVVPWASVGIPAWIPTAILIVIFCLLLLGWAGMLPALRR